MLGPFFGPILILRTTPDFFSYQYYFISAIYYNAKRNSNVWSKNISEKYTDKIFSGSWEYEGDRRNFGIEKCKSEWILEIDADEHVSNKLGIEIIEKINQNTDFSNFHIKINNYIGDKLVKFGWGGSFGRGGVTCLFKKGSKSWGKQRVHPELFFNGKYGPDLKNPIEHYFVKDISELIQKFNTWTFLKSLDLIGIRSSFAPTMSM